MISRLVGVKGVNGSFSSCGLGTRVDAFQAPALVATVGEACCQVLPIPQLRASILQLCMQALTYSATMANSKFVATCYLQVLLLVA